jgi:hypothetical protein
MNMTGPLRLFQMGMVTAMDADHLDIYVHMNHFVDAISYQADESIGLLLYRSDLESDWKSDG